MAKEVAQLKHTADVIRSQTGRHGLPGRYYEIPGLTKKYKRRSKMGKVHRVNKVKRKVYTGKQGGKYYLKKCSKTGKMVKVYI